MEYEILSNLFLAGAVVCVIRLLFAGNGNKQMAKKLPVKVQRHISTTVWPNNRDYF